MNRYARPDNFNTRIRNPLLREHYVYRVWDQNRVLLYIGCSMQPAKRFAEHKVSSRWADQVARVSLSGPYNYETARAVEYAAIESERSVYNYSSERRELAAIRNRIIERHVLLLVDQGRSWPEAIDAAMHRADRILRDWDHEMLTDLSIPEARRADQIDARGVLAA